MLESRSIWSQAPPEPRTRLSNNPTLLFSWWCTCFSAVIILTRLSGRKIRSNCLFREDWIMAAAMIPLFIRMGFIHVVLIYGTNNVSLEGHTYPEQQIYHREIGSRLVLAARIFYAAYIWMSKLTVSEFLKRITIRIWRRSYEMTLQGIRIFLLISFLAVVIATLSECQPFDHYWQVIPDPGPHCRQGFAQLISMATFDIITDVLLIAFPIPIVVRSGQTWKRKLQLVLLFSLSAIMIAVTATRVPEVIEKAGRQQYRTVWASCEILASTAVSNGVILGSFLRDKGTKRNKYKQHSVSESFDRSSARRPTITTLHRYDSDEDLFFPLGYRIPEHLRDTPDRSPRPAPPALPAQRNFDPGQYRMPDFGPLQTHKAGGSSDSDDSMRKMPIIGPQPLPSTPSTTRRVSFFDVGGLLEDGMRSRSTTLVESSSPGTIAQDFAAPVPQHSHRETRPVIMPSATCAHDSSSGHHQHFRVPNSPRRYPGALSNAPRPRASAPIGILGPMLERHETQQSLQDAGGLLGGSGSPLSIPSTIPSSPPSGIQSPRLGHHRHDTETSLQDVGGLLSPDHELDVSAVALRRARGDNDSRQRFTTDSPRPAECRGPDEMSLHDPGGLLGP